MNVRVDKKFAIGERVSLYLYWELYDLFNTANFCNSYEEAVSATTFNTPRAFCQGPSNNGALSGASTATVQSLHTELGLRFEF